MVTGQVMRRHRHMEDEDSGGEEQCLVHVFSVLPAHTHSVSFSLPVGRDGDTRRTDGGDVAGRGPRSSDEDDVLGLLLLPPGVMTPPT